MKDYYTKINKKKIRGWKRRIKQLDRWGKHIEKPYLDYFLSEHGDYTYERCFLPPFYVLNKRHPPLWFYKLIIAKFIIAYQNWQKKFDDLGVPYDLQLWLYDPAYIRSEIICYKMGGPQRQMKLQWEAEQQKAFPFSKFAHKACDLTQFEWTLGDEEAVHFEEELEDEYFTAAELLNEGFIKKVQNENQKVYYAKCLSDIWIGRVKTNKDLQTQISNYHPIPDYLRKL